MAHSALPESENLDPTDARARSGKGDAPVTVPCIDCVSKVIEATDSRALPSCMQVPCACGCHARANNFEDLGAALGRLVEGKQAVYGDSFGKSGAIMRILYPAGVAVEQLDDALTVVRILDKLFRGVKSDQVGQNIEAFRYTPKTRAI